MAVGPQAWFAELFGFKEIENVSLFSNNRRKFEHKAPLLHCKENGKTFTVGHFSTPSVKDLRARNADCGPTPGAITVKHIVTATSMENHAAHPGAVFQVASGFNCLHMRDEKHVPENGVHELVSDHSQGPDSAMACAAGALVRSYFGLSGRGQTRDSQINTLDDLGSALGNAKESSSLWRIENGYCFVPNEAALRTIGSKIAASREALLPLIKVGVHADVGLTFVSRVEPRSNALNRAPEPPPTVSQVLCAALPLQHSSKQLGGKDSTTALWEPFERLILDAAYEATLWCVRTHVQKTADAC